MSLYRFKFIVFVILVCFSNAFSLERVTIYFQNGEEKDCTIDKYESGNWVEIIDETGSKKTIEWDLIKEISFKKDQEPQEKINTASEPERLNLAQRLAKKEKERKEKEASEAQKQIEGSKQSKEDVISSQASKSKATLVYKNGTALECMIEKYEVGKYAEIIDSKGNKRIVSWDNINEIIFANEEETPEKLSSTEPELVTVPAAAPAVTAAPAAVLPVTTEPESSSGSMLDQFKKNRAETETDSEPETISPEEQRHIEDIRQENEYEKPEVDLNKDTGKLSVSYYQTLESDANRRSWIENGGILKGSGMTVNYTMVSKDMGSYAGVDMGQFDMNGFGMTYSGTLKWIKPPSYDENKSTWSAFSMGAMGSFNITFGSMEILTSTTNITMLAYEFSGNIGYTFGLGRYLSPEDWKGVMLAFYWKPNFVMSRTTMESNGYYTEGDPETAFNMTGFQWTIDFGDFGALADKLAKKAHFSINGFIIPETDTTPFMMSIGIGMVWY